jgi:hypothetical protein
LHREPAKRILRLHNLGFQTAQVLGKPRKFVILQVNLLLKLRLESGQAAVQ